MRRATGVLAGVVRQVEVDAHQNVFLKHNKKNVNEKRMIHTAV